MLRVPQFHLDHFQEGIRKNLYLEFFFKSCRVLVTPDLNTITTGKADEEEEASLEIILKEKPDVIDKIKDYLQYDLTHYSALLETNSYYLTLNDYLLIARFVSLDDDPLSFIVKLYTINAMDLPANYSDKIYIGRDRISLQSLHRPHFGLKFIRNSLIEQFLKLKDRLKDHLGEEAYLEIESEFLGSMEDSIGDFAESAKEIEASFPNDISSKTMEESALIQANVKYRELKHILIEVEETLREMRGFMFRNNQDVAVRYVTKFLKDVTNNVNFIMFKVNGRISDAVNRIHL